MLKKNFRPAARTIFCTSTFQMKVTPLNFSPKFGIFGRKHSNKKKLFRQANI